MNFKPISIEHLHQGYYWAVRPNHAPASMLISAPMVVEVREHDQKLQVYTHAGPQPESVNAFWFGDYVGTNQGHECFVPGKKPPKGATISKEALKHPGAKVKAR